MNKLKKVIPGFFFLPALLFLLVGCGSGKNDFFDIATESNQIRVYEVFGMDCPGCHDGLENLVRQIAGVKAVKANWKKQQLQVAIIEGGEVSDEEILDAIKKANFTPGERLR